jgi:signal recognition particle subunit SEC65
MDEYHYQLKETSATKKISIQDMIKILEDLGFKYKNESDWEDNECMLAKLKLI